MNSECLFVLDFCSGLLLLYFGVEGLLEMGGLIFLVALNCNLTFWGLVGFAFFYSSWLASLALALGFLLWILYMVLWWYVLCFMLSVGSYYMFHSSVAVFAHNSQVLWFIVVCDSFLGCSLYTEKAFGLFQFEFFICGLRSSLLSCNWCNFLHDWVLKFLSLMQVLGHPVSSFPSVLCKKASFLTVKVEEHKWYLWVFVSCEAEYIYIDCSRNKRPLLYILRLIFILVQNGIFLCSSICTRFFCRSSWLCPDSFLACKLLIILWSSFFGGGDMFVIFSFPFA